MQQSKNATKPSCGFSFEWTIASIIV